MIWWGCRQRCGASGLVHLGDRFNSAGLRYGNSDPVTGMYGLQGQPALYFELLGRRRSRSAGAALDRSDSYGTIDAVDLGNGPANGLLGETCRTHQGANQDDPRNFHVFSRWTASRVGAKWPLCGTNAVLPVRVPAP